jgi:thiol:disulfide interchange protein DsbG
MKLRRLVPLAAASLALVFALSGCSKQDAPTQTATKATSPQQSLDDVIAKAKGFTVGSMMSANTVYVMFDPQCPHCGHLWEQIQPLMKKVKFVWLPVAFIGPKSAPQGAKLMTAANPLELMTQHEVSILAGTGGIDASSDIPADVAEAIKTNTALLNSMGVESVPYIMAKNNTSGQVVTHSGAMQTAELAVFLGVQ